MYLVTKTLGHERGLSAAFRQWQANSHCNLIHGYALSISMQFKADELDNRNWVIDFGSFKPIKKWLETQFDHKTLVAHDDPKLQVFRTLHNSGLVDLVILDNVGCESFAHHVGRYVNQWLKSNHDYDMKIRGLDIVSVTVAEHGANSATWRK